MPSASERLRDDAENLRTSPKKTSPIRPEELIYPASRIRARGLMKGAVGTTEDVTNQDAKIPGTEVEANRESNDWVPKARKHKKPQDQMHW